MSEYKPGEYIMGLICTFIMITFLGVGYIIGYEDGYIDGSRYMVEESVDNQNVFKARQNHYSAEILIQKELEAN